jgi:hypothetical protein
MRREETLSLLKELLIACRTMHYAPIVSLKKGLQPDSWELRVKWVSSDDEKDCFRSIILKNGLEATEADGYTIFHKPQPS